MQNITNRLRHSSRNELQTDGISYTDWPYVTTVKKEMKNPVKT